MNQSEYQELLRVTLLAPRNELLGLTLKFGMLDCYSLTRPGFSKELAREMRSQIREGVSNVNRFAQVAPHHDAFLWEHHPFEGAALRDNVVEDVAARSKGKRAVLSFPTPLFCMTAVQFLTRNNVMDVVVFQRSLDLWLGLPYDLHILQALWDRAACSIKADLGTGVWFVGSAHIREEYVPSATTWLEEVSDDSQ